MARGRIGPRDNGLSRLQWPVVTYDRYAGDVLAPGWQQAHRTKSQDCVLERGLVLEDADSGFCGAVQTWENGLVVLEDRHRARRSFPIGPGFLLEGQPVTLCRPQRSSSQRQQKTASGSVATPGDRAKTALPSRIFVEGRHDAELVEKVWGDDLRHVGVVVELLDGVDDLERIVTEFAPATGRRLGALVDHLVPGSKESQLADRISRGRWGDCVMITGHPYVDIWQAVKPELLGLDAWPQIPRSVEWKKGICDRLGWPHASQADIAAAWQHILGRVHSWADLERPLLTQVETLIDFVTQDHVG